MLLNYFAAKILILNLSIFEFLLDDLDVMATKGMESAA